MSEDIKLYAIMCVKNTAMMICFTILAIVFKHWWIALFAGLFWSYPKSEEDKK